MNLLRLLLLFAAIVPAMAFAGTSGPTPIPPAPAFQLSTPALTLCRGVVNDVPITVSNPGGQPMTSLQLGTVASRNIYVIGNGTVNQANVSANSSATMYLPIFVSLNTSSLVSVGISVNYNYLTLYSDSEVRNISFSVQTCPSQLSVQTGRVVTSGRIGNLTLGLKNVGSTVLSAISLSISLPAQSSAILSSQPVRIGTLAPGESASVNETVFFFRNASQSFPLNVSIDMYNGTRPVQILETVPLLSLGIINLTPSSITLSPTMPSAGSIFSASFILTDVGTAGASAVTVTPLPPAGITPYGANSVFVGDMQIDTQTPVTITMMSRAGMEGTYDIPMRINYLNSLRQNMSTTISVPVTFGSSNSIYETGTAGRPTTYKRGSSPLPWLEFVAIVVLAYLYAHEKGFMKDGIKLPKIELPNIRRRKKGKK